MGRRTMFEGVGYQKPVVIVHYECGPPVFDQCEDCQRALVMEVPPEIETDGLKQTICGFNQDPLREGQCVLQVQFPKINLLGMDIGIGP